MKLSADWGGRYWGWLARAALPLWASQGIDAAGGFQEALDMDGKSLSGPRRSRVQGRQSFVFAYAGKLGWDGPWRQAAPVGLAYLDRHCRRDDGLYATLSGPAGTVLDSTAMTYDQAFILLAQAALHGCDPDAGWNTRALDLLSCVMKLRRHSSGGFIEAGGRFVSNPHMHLLEACLAWAEAGGAPVWRETAESIVTLALNHFIDVEKRMLREFFDAGWRPAPGREGEVVEPGHQFEWAWLLERWGRLTGDARAHAAAKALFRAGKQGIDTHRAVAIDEIDFNNVPRRATARLWPQTEWLKAACLLGDDADIDAAAAALWRYLDTPKAGLWWDKMREDGSFVDEPVPASSLYHIICAVASLKDVEH